MNIEFNFWFLITSLHVITYKLVLAEMVTPPSASQEIGIDLKLKDGLVNGSTVIPKCMGEDININKMMSAIETCGAEAFDKNNEEKVPSSGNGSNLCFTACIWKKIELVGDDMMFTQDVTRFVLGTFPPMAQPKVIDAMTKCSRANKWPVSMDNNCTSYGPMRKCMMDAVVVICRGNGGSVRS